MLIDHRLCSFCVLIGILLLGSFRLRRCNALTSVFYYCSSLRFEVEEVWGFGDNTRTPD